MRDVGRLGKVFEAVCGISGVFAVAPSPGKSRCRYACRGVRGVDTRRRHNSCDGGRLWRDCVEKCLQPPLTDGLEMGNIVA